MGDDDFPYVEIPDHLRPRLGLPDPGTRMYRAYGADDAFAEWWDAVCEVCGESGSVSPGGVSMYARMSRAAVYKRLAEGRLTAFCFHQERKTRTRFLKRDRISTERTPVTNIPVSECKAWAEQLSHLSRRERKQLEWGSGEYAGQSIELTPAQLKQRERQANG